MIGLKTRATDIVVLVGDLPLALNTTMEPIKQILETFSTCANQGFM